MNGLFLFKSLHAMTTPLIKCHLHQNLHFSKWEFSPGYSINRCTQPFTVLFGSSTVYISKITQGVHKNQPAEQKYNEICILLPFPSVGIRLPSTSKESHPWQAPLMLPTKENVFF
jgi:hypothetical protein